MGQMFPALKPTHEVFIKKQKMFFVASAPMDSEGHVNISPKGYDAFRILSSSEVAYLDVTGSGNETSAHIDENGRLTIMFIALEGPPMIMRLYGTGQVILPGTTRWEELIGNFDMLPGARQIIYSKIHAVKTSCGMSIPFFQYEGEREALTQWAIKKGEQGLKSYHQEKNMVSMDGVVTPMGRLIDN